MKEHLEIKPNSRVLVDGVQVLSHVDEKATVISVYKNSIKVQLDSTGKKWYITKSHCTPFIEQM